MSEVLARLNSTEYSNEELSPFQPDAILPVQYYPDQRGGRSQEAVKRLMHAVLADAGRCFQRNIDARNRARRKEFAEARSWLFVDNSCGPFSFLNICDALQVDARAIRRSLIRWRYQHKAAKGSPREMSA